MKNSTITPKTKSTFTKTLSTALIVGVFLFSFVTATELPLHRTPKVSAATPTVLADDYVWKVTACKASVATSTYGPLWKITVVVLRKHSSGNGYFTTANLNYSYVNYDYFDPRWKTTATADKWQNETTFFAGYVGSSNKNPYVEVATSIYKVSPTSTPKWTGYSTPSRLVSFVNNC